MVDEAKRHGVRAIAAVGTAGLRIAANGNGSRGRHPGTHRRSHRRDLGRRGRAAGLSGRPGRAGIEPGSLVVFDTGGGSSQFTFGHDADRGRAFQRRGRRRALHRALRLDHAVSPEVLREAMAAISADLSRIDGRPVPDPLVGDGRRGDQHHGGQHRPRQLRPRRSSRAASSTAPRSIARSSSTGRSTPTRAAPSSACSRSGRKSSSPVPASSAR
jgi:hypothetical protein